jgi:hypothetical protein
METFANLDSLNLHQGFIEIRTETTNSIRHGIAFQRLYFEGKAIQNFLNLSHSNPQSRFFPEITYRFDIGSSENYNGQNERQTLHEPFIRYAWNRIALSGSMRTHTSTTSQLTGSRLHQYRTEVALSEIRNSSLTLAYQIESNYRKDNRWDRERHSETIAINTSTRLRNHLFTSMFSHRVVQQTEYDDTGEQSVNTQTFEIAEIRTRNSFFRNGLQLNNTYSLKNTEFFLRSREFRYVGAGMGQFDSTKVLIDNGDWDWITSIVAEPVRSTEVQANFNVITFPGQIFTGSTRVPSFLHRTNLETNITISEQTTNPNRKRVYFLLPAALKNDYSIYSRQDFRQSVWLNVIPNRLITRYSFRTDQILDNRFVERENRSLLEHELSLRLMRVRNSNLELTLKKGSETESRFNMNSDILSSRLDIRTNLTHNFILATMIGYEEEMVHSRGNSQKIYRYRFSETVSFVFTDRYRLNLNIRLDYNAISNPIATHLPHDRRAGLNMQWSSSLNYRINDWTSLLFDYSGHQHPGMQVFHNIRMEVRAEF